MRQWIWLALCLALGSTVAHAADYKTLRNLNAPPPIQLDRLPAGTKPRPVQFARAVVAPKDGEAWALAYYSLTIEDPDHPRQRLGLLNWSAGRIEGEATAFARIFKEEANKAGFNTGEGESLFGESDSGADLKLGVLIDDMKGRFCADCPNLFNRNGIPATVVMTANWEVYSSLERKTVAKITTNGGADMKTQSPGTLLPAIYGGFRENVRRLLANDEFRKVVTSPVAGPATSAAAAVANLQLVRGARQLGVDQAATAVAVVFAADGSGSGFLVSADGYLVTNQHVVGGSKYVKLKWSDGAETLGEVIRVDARRDVALVKTDANGRAPLDLRLSPVRQGEPVYAIGSPLGEALQNTMTRGIVSATRVVEGQPIIQSDVAVTHGNSGGPLLDENGRVIGITESGMAPAGSPVGLNFFIPIDDALRVLALTPAPEPTVAQASSLAPEPVRAAKKR